MITALKIIRTIESYQIDCIKKIIENPEKKESIKQEYIKHIMNFQNGINTQYGDCEFLDRWKKYISNAALNCIQDIQEL